MHIYDVTNPQWFFCQSKADVKCPHHPQEIPSPSVGRVWISSATSQYMYTVNNIPIVELMQYYIWDPSGAFSISSVA